MLGEILAVKLIRTIIWGWILKILK